MVEEKMEARLDLELGFRFKPTEEELIKFFLSKRVRGQPLTPNPILECDLYGQRSPWEIFDESANHHDDKNIWFCFTRLKKRSKKRVSRVAGSGTWHGEKSAKEIVDSKNNNNVVIGFKKTFTFKIKKKKTDWIMHEFTLADHHEETSSEYVLCKIKKLKPKAVLVLDDEEEVEEEMASTSTEATTLLINNNINAAAEQGSVEPYYYYALGNLQNQQHSEAVTITKGIDEPTEE